MRERGALVAASIERFAAADVETILAQPPAAARERVAAARRRFLDAVERGGGGHVEPEPDGLLALRIQAVAARALGARDASHSP